MWTAPFSVTFWHRGGNEGRSAAYFVRDSKLAVCVVVDVLDILGEHAEKERYFLPNVKAKQIALRVAKALTKEFSTMAPTKPRTPQEKAVQTLLRMPNRWPRLVAGRTYKWVGSGYLNACTSVLNQIPTTFSGYTPSFRAEVWLCADGFCHFFNPDNWAEVARADIGAGERRKEPSSAKEEYPASRADIVAMAFDRDDDF